MPVDPRALQPGKFIQSDDPAIIAFARDAAAGAADRLDASIRLYYAVRDEIRYDFTPVMDSRAVWLASATVTRGKGFCQQKAVLLVALARAVGIPAGTVHVTGIPVMPVFGQPISRAECAAELGLDPARPTIALMAGSAGVTGIDNLVDRLLPIDERLQVIALAGRNESLLASLRRRAERFPGRLVASGFTTTIERLMAASDVVVTKSGGLTTSECLAMGLPMIVVSPIPGQEERNALFLLEHGAALQADDASALAFRISRLIREPKTLAALRRNARSLGKPDAGRHVIETVLAHR